MIDSVHERSLAIVTHDNSSSFENLLRKCKFPIKIRQRNFQELTETCKVVNGISPAVMENFFIIRENKYNLQSSRKYLMKIGKE